MHVTVKHNLSLNLLLNTFTYNLPVSSSDSLLGYDCSDTEPPCHQSWVDTAAAAPQNTPSSSKQSQRKTGTSHGSLVYCREKGKHLMGEFPRQHNTGQTYSNCGVWHQDGNVSALYLALLLNQVVDLLNTKLNSSLCPQAIVMSSSSSMTEQALRLIKPRARLSLGFMKLCCSENLES